MKETMKDREVRALIERVRHEDESAFGELLSLYEPLIRSAIAKHTPEGISRQDKEDWRQEALLFFYNAIMTYNLEQERVEFGLYAKICITNGLISHLRAFRRQSSSEILPYTGDESPEVENAPDTFIIEEESVKQLYGLIERNLSEYENKVWSLYVSGYSTKVISEALQKSEKSIDNAIFRIRCKLKRILHT